MLFILLYPYYDLSMMTTPCPCRGSPCTTTTLWTVAPIRTALPRSWSSGFAGCLRTLPPPAAAPRTTASSHYLCRQLVRHSCAPISQATAPGEREGGRIKGGSGELERWLQGEGWRRRSKGEKERWVPYIIKKLFKIGKKLDCCMAYMLC
jgi:hypothetical protein